MAELNLSSSIDSKSGFCSKTKTYYSLRPQVLLPPEHHHVSVAEYAFSILRTCCVSPQNTTALIDSSTGTRLSYLDFLQTTQALTESLYTRFGFKKGDTAFILSPNSMQIPLLYFSLLSLGVILSPANPNSTITEISCQISLSKPLVAFATSATASKLPCLKYGTILLDSDDFQSMTRSQNQTGKYGQVQVKVKQTDTAAILYSSGTTGPVKGVELSHRNFIAFLAGNHSIRPNFTAENPVGLFTIPLFHIYGMFFIIRVLAMGETVVMMDKYDFIAMLKTVETYRINYLPLPPPLLVALGKIDLVGNYDLSSLSVVVCGGAPLGMEVFDRFVTRFPHVHLVQGYGLTEVPGVASTRTPDETKMYSSVGRFSENVEAKIVDCVTKEALSPGQKGELWVRGPTVMKGYVGDNEATAFTINSDGWFKTGDLCYVDSDGFLYIVDRIKELIKYKGYQVPPVELEQLLQSHPEILDAAVIPYPNEEAGQIPMAFVVREPRSELNEAQIMDFIAKQVAPHKKIRRVTFIKSIPRTTAGKILRRELKDSALSVLSARL